MKQSKKFYKECCPLDTEGRESVSVVLENNEIERRKNSLPFAVIRYSSYQDSNSRAKLLIKYQKELGKLEKQMIHIKK